MIWNGADDTTFDASDSMRAYEKLFTKLGNKGAVSVMNVEKGLDHRMSHAGYKTLVKFI